MTRGHMFARTNASPTCGSAAPCRGAASLLPISARHMHGPTPRREVSAARGLRARTILVRRTPTRRPARNTRGLTLLEALLALGLLAVVVWLLIPGADPARRHGQRLACMAKLRELHQGAAAYLGANGDCFPLAWHVAGPPIAEDLSNLAYARFALYEQLHPTFRHVVTPQEVEQNVGILPARQQKFRDTADFWKCPSKGWTNDYFAPEVVFRRSDQPARKADLVAALPAADRPLFADVNASYPDPAASHLQDPGHNHELRNGFSVVAESGVDVFIGVGPSLRAEGLSSSSRLDFRHGDAANVLFLDGHADPVPPTDESRLARIHNAWNYAAGKPPEK